ncbi:MAG: helix-turn-helix transcriptional regulator [Reichenbachiella sp.]|uniref:helix-turn-helix transcriptional regulator n=1 Tax=Reichenbachiella sp. TaxID=2184521 RepID=UPI003266C5BB
MSTSPTKVFQPKVLTNYLDRFEVFELDNEIRPFRVLPLGVVQVFFQLNLSVYHSTSFTDGWTKRPEAFLGGPYNLGYTMAAEKGVEMFSLKFLPGRYRYFFPNPIDDFKNKLIPLSDIWGQQGEVLIDRIFMARSHEERCELLESFLLRHMYHLKYSPIEAAVQTVIQRKGICRIKDLAVASNLSTSQFRSRFIAEVGLSPKEFQRVIRVGALDEYYNRHPKTSFTRLAYRFQFHDQSHFTRDFQSITGQTPKNYYS